jgi:thymidylate kinase
MRGNVITEYKEEPLAVKSFSPEEVHSTLSRISEETVKKNNSKGLLIISETDDVNAELLSQRINFSGTKDYINKSVDVNDAYIDSSFVYQGVARGVGIKNVERANGFALSYMPNITFFLDVRPEVGLKRLSGRDKMDRLDLESIDFHNKVYNGYLEVMGMYPERIKRIDGEQAPELVIKQITDVLDKVIKG